MINIFSIFNRNNELAISLEQIRPRLYRLAYSWTHNASLADDLVQDTMIKALKSSHQLKDPSRLNSWLFSILSNCWRDHFRQHRVMEDIDEIEDFHYAHNDTPEHVHTETQIVARVRAAVNKLPLGQRQVITLVDLEELSYVEVASILDIPIGTVMSRLCRARSSMKTLLKEIAPEHIEHVEKIRRIK